MTTVAQAAGRLATTYDGADGGGLDNLYYYLQAAVFAEYYSVGEEVQWPAAVRRTIFAAVDALVANPNFHHPGEATGNLLVVVISVMDGPDARVGYLPVVVDWLSRWTRARARHYGQARAAGAALRFIFNSHDEPGFEAAVATLPMVATLRRLALGDWMLGTEAEPLVIGGASELARFLRWPDLPWHEDVRVAVGEIFSRYEPLGFGAGVWVAAASSVAYYDDCAAYGICAALDGLEGNVLVVEHRCSDAVRIRGQDLNSAQLGAACAALRRQEAAFHWRLKTGRELVANDFTAVHEVVAFADYDNYNTYSYLFFGNDTDNGGIYLEGDPTRRGNVSRHLGYVADWLRDKPIWNLEHEYVHHLDGRFNLWGDFADARVDTHQTVWWIEGLAEYLSQRDDNEAALALTDASPLPLDEIFETTYNSGVPLVYRWSYLAVRFMFERQPAVVERLRTYLRAGDYDGYLSWVSGGLGASHEAAWRSWFGEVEAVADYDVAAVRLELPAALSTFDDELAVVVLDLAGDHPTGQGLVVSATSSDPDVVMVSVADSQVTLTAVAPGVATVRLAVSDAWGRTSRRLNLEVNDACPNWLCRGFTSGWRQAVSVPAEE